MQSILRNAPAAPKKYAVRASALRSDRGKVEEKKLLDEIANLKKKIEA